MPHCCAFGCSKKGAVLHVFPNPNPDRFKVWVQLIGGKLGTPSAYEFYKKKRICDLHFTEEHRNRFKRLNAIAVPTLCLLDTSCAQHKYFSWDSQSTYLSFRYFCPRVAPGTRHCQRPTFAPRIDYQHIFHSAASMPVTPAIQQSEVPTIINNICTADSSVFAEHNYSVMSRSKRKTLDEGSNKREVQLKVKQLQMEDNRLPKRGLSYKHCRVPDSMTLCSTSQQSSAFSENAITINEAP